MNAELIVDNFAGGGGASLGIEWAVGRAMDIAINHDPEAVATSVAAALVRTNYIENARLGAV